MQRARPPDRLRAEIRRTEARITKCARVRHPYRDSGSRASLLACLGVRFPERSAAFLSLLCIRVEKRFDDGNMYQGTVSSYSPHEKWWGVVSKLLFLSRASCTRDSD